MQAIKIPPLVSCFGSLYVSLASIVILIPNIEIAIWWWISAIVFIPSILLAIIAGSAIEKLLATLSFMFVVLVPFGFPGTLLGWGGSLLIGLQCGRMWLSQFLNGRIDMLFWSLATAPLFSAQILFDFANEGISYELLSNFFQAASINYANSVLLGSASLVATCMILQDISIFKQVGIINNSKYVRKIALFLMPISLVFAVSMDYRTGVIGILGLLLFYFSRFSFVFRYSLLALVVISLVYFYEFVLNFLVPGRVNVGDLFTELVDDGNRFDRATNFAAKVLVDKTHFAAWIDYFSVSALGDFLAVTFPLSFVIIIYFFIYFKNIFKLGVSRIPWAQRSSLILILGSGLAVSLLQPDFFNMFVFGFQISLINSYLRFQGTNKNWVDQ
jgi:hypothetical protein